jgi:hypothetical protein
MKFLTSLILALALCVPASATMKDVVNATVRISPSQGQGAMGTGCVTSVTDTDIYIITNAHVVGGKRSVNIEFWRAGLKCNYKVPATLTFQRGPSDQIDVAIMKVSKRDTGGWSPKPIPLADPSWQYADGQELLSAGCARGAWPTAWSGHAVGLDRQGHLVFEPIPAQGRSGSAITDAAGERIVALLFAKDPEGRGKYGYAVTIHRLARELAYEKASPPEREKLLAQWGRGPMGQGQVGPQGCPPGGCPPGMGSQSGRPNRQIQLFGRQEIQPSPQSNPVPFPVAPTQDLSGIESRLDLLIRMREADLAVPPPLPEPGPPAEPEGPMSPEDIIDLMARDGVSANAARIENVERVVIELGGDLGDVAEDADGVIEKVDDLKGATDVLKAENLGLIDKMAAMAEGRGLKVTPWLLTMVGGAGPLGLLVIGFAVFMVVRRDIKAFIATQGEDKLMIRHVADTVTKLIPGQLDDRVIGGAVGKLEDIIARRGGMVQPQAPAPPVVVVQQPAAPAVQPAPAGPVPPNVAVVNGGPAAPVPPVEPQA